ncbi:hypothetical protein BDQ12DRAFT_700878 [Crucibulum laeve]|uniref:Uncharacterized protein n=1 Tax=Crucibulum laeve TaxID=68775 RepID=A0A5C3LJW2_9AGAR|nr:hypothetical protein BDQ12DRAFT_700878 [Crucibulum laeve]
MHDTEMDNSLPTYTHVYLHRYASLLRTRTSVPLIRSGTTRQRMTEERTPIGPQYWDREEKLKFMDRHGIDVTVNTSLDFLPAPQAHSLTSERNNDLEEYCASSLDVIAGGSIKHLYGFGLLPLISTSALLKIVQQISELPHLRGLWGIGKRLDDKALNPAGLAIFLDNGHLLLLALGFVFETTIAATHVILSGVFDRFPTLCILLAHTGGALPALPLHLASCINHGPAPARYLTQSLKVDHALSV